MSIITGPFSCILSGDCELLFDRLISYSSPLKIDRLFLFYPMHSDVRRANQDWRSKAAQLPPSHEPFSHQHCVVSAIILPTPFSGINGTTLLLGLSWGFFSADAGRHTVLSKILSHSELHSFLLYAFFQFAQRDRSRSRDTTRHDYDKMSLIGAHSLGILQCAFPRIAADGGWVSVMRGPSTIMSHPAQSSIELSPPLHFLAFRSKLDVEVRGTSPPISGVAGLDFSSSFTRSSKGRGCLYYNFMHCFSFLLAARRDGDDYQGWTFFFLFDGRRCGTRVSRSRSWIAGEQKS